MALNPDDYENLKAHAEKLQAALDAALDRAAKAEDELHQTKLKLSAAETPKPKRIASPGNKASAYGSKNKIVTKEMYDKALADLRATDWGGEQPKTDEGGPQG